VDWVARTVAESRRVYKGVRRGHSKGEALGKNETERSNTLGDSAGFAPRDEEGQSRGDGWLIPRKTRNRMWIFRLCANGLSCHCHHSTLCVSHLSRAPSRLL
jgi:hypothetical protein